MKEIFEISNFTGRDMMSCRLQSGVERWISLDLAMTFHKSAAKLVSWPGKNKPGDARIAIKSKDFGLKMLEERAKEVQDKFSLRSRRSQSRQNSPAKADGPAQNIQESPEDSSPLPRSLQEDNQEVRVLILRQIPRSGIWRRRSSMESSLPIRSWKMR